MKDNGNEKPVLNLTGTVTLPDSRATLEVNYVSPLLLNDIRKALRRIILKPEQPLVEVAYGETKKWEANPAHPEYRAALTDYNADFGQEFFQKLVRFGVQCEVDAQAVSKLRERAAAQGELELPEDDLVLYVTRILVTSQADMQAIMNAVLRRSQPTEEAVTEKVADDFRPPV